MNIFVTGIDTDIGKTFISAILVNAFKADYFKPIQCGDLTDSDSHKISKWTEAKVHPETFRFNAPQSPHLAASLENRNIKISDIELPKTNNNLVIEGAGGLLVPLSDDEYIIDIPKKLNLPVILVCKNYLGSLNHTLLSIEALKERGIEILGLIFNGQENPKSEDFLVKKSGIKKLLNVDWEEEINKQVIEKYSRRLAQWI
ncbi:MAG: dethiobiotin synthase [Epsilonproteobacteria bacterium]|nr:MAG: dethiobiotin synthase [Campylobacterota bacterium]RLA66055.1 MAG: dethiobiotin synthase [Campylobacterota bacterium]